jgi:hypothetical protein
MKVIWKAHGKEKYCKDCWYSIERPKALAKPTSKPNPVSKKMSKTMSEYERKRVAFFALHPFCQARLAGCTIGATDIHHLYSGKDRSKYYLVMNTWKAVCRNCHDYIHNKLSEKDAIALDLKRKE